MSLAAPGPERCRLPVWIGRPRANFGQRGSSDLLRTGTYRGEQPLTRVDAPLRRLVWSRTGFTGHKIGAIRRNITPEFT